MGAIGGCRRRPGPYDRAATGQEALSLKGHTDTVLSVCFSPDGKRLASASHDRTVKVWDAEVGSDTANARGRVGQREQANACEQAGEWFAAAFHLGWLIKEEPTNPALHVRRGLSLADLGRWKEAGADLVTACQLMARKP